MLNILLYIFGPYHAKKYKLFVTCDMSQPCNMSHFENIENSGIPRGIQNSNFGFIFEARTKSPHDIQEKCIFLNRGTEV